MFDRFEEPMLEVMRGARNRCLEFGHEVLDTDHLLLSLLAVSTSRPTRAKTLLQRLDVAPEAVVAAMLERVVVRERPARTPKQLPFTDRSKRVLEGMLEVAARQGDTALRTDHFLLALATVSGGPAEPVLQSFGLTPERVASALEPPPCPPPPTPRNP